MYLVILVLGSRDTPGLAFCVVSVTQTRAPRVPISPIGRDTGSRHSPDFLRQPLCTGLECEEHSFLLGNEKKTF